MAAGPSLSAAQRNPLVGLWQPTAGICAFDAADVRAAGSGGRVQPSDQHIHKIDCYAGGTREGTIQLYVESGYDRETAEAVVTADEMAASQFHVGSDASRIGLRALPDGSAAWLVCVELDPTRLAAGQRPRAQVSLLVALPSDSAPAVFFRRWAPEGDASPVAAARQQLLARLDEAGIGAEAAVLVRNALQGGQKLI